MVRNRARLLSRAARRGGDRFAARLATMATGSNVAAARARSVKRAALRIGFDAAGICDLRPVEREALRNWLARGYAAGMSYMHRQAPRREQPQRIAPACTRAVMVLKNYHQEASQNTGAAARVARYAWGEDYHRVVGDQLALLAAALVEMGSSAEHTRWYVDVGPVPERELAQRAGLGWIAKNTMLIRPDLGSFTFIGTVFTDLDLAVDEPFLTDHCGSCRLCLDACPTAAFAAERVLDARRCISYLTIEHRGSFTAEQGRLLNDWLFGCDICQDVCPWNGKFARPSTEPRFTARPHVIAPDLDALTSMDAATFERLYGDTAFERAGAAGLARNARQVLTNASTSTADAASERQEAKRGMDAKK